MIFRTLLIAILGLATADGVTAQTDDAAIAEWRAVLALSQEEVETQCDAGNQAACARLGILLYDDGRQDLNRALELLWNGCRAGFGRPCAWVGLMYERGHIEDPNATAEEASLRLYDHACEQGSGIGCRLAARDYSARYNESYAIKNIGRLVNGRFVGPAHSAVLDREAANKEMDALSRGCFDVAFPEYRLCRDFAEQAVKGPDDPRSQRATEIGRTALDAIQRFCSPVARTARNIDLTKQSCELAREQCRITKDPATCDFYIADAAAVCIAHRGAACGYLMELMVTPNSFDGLSARPTREMQLIGASEWPDIHLRAAADRTRAVDWAAVTIATCDQTSSEQDCARAQLACAEGHQAICAGLAQTRD